MASTGSAPHHPSLTLLLSGSHHGHFTLTIINAIAKHWPRNNHVFYITLQ